MEEREKNLSVIKKQFGIVMIIVASALLILTTFEFLSGVKWFFLGVFGIMIYPILLLSIFAGIALTMNQKFVYSPRYIIYLGLCFFFFVCVLHTIFAGTGGVSISYGEYLKQCYNAHFTPGGVLIGVFVYPLSALFHDIAGVVIYGIGLVMSLYFVATYLDSVKKQTVKKPVPKQVAAVKTEAVAAAPVQQIAKPEPAPKTEILASEVKENPADEEIFIKDEKPSEPSVAEIAKQKLGLGTQNLEQSPTDQSVSAEAKLFGEKKDNVSWQTRAFSQDRPQKFVYDEKEKTSSQKNNPMFEKNKEYLSTIHDINNVNENPIINAEDYEDYKQKMKMYGERNSSPISRENTSGGYDATRQGNLNDGIIRAERQTPNYFARNDKFPSPSFNKEVEPDEDVPNFGIEPEKDNFSNISGLFDTNFGDSNDSNFDEDDFIKPDDDFPKTRNFNTSNNFEIGSQSPKTTPQDNRSERFMDKVGDDSVEESLGKTVNLSNVPPRTFNFEAIGGGSSSNAKKIEPNFEYNSNYIRPPIDLLKTYTNAAENINYQEKIDILERVLEDFRVPAKVEAVRRGAAVTRYELHMPTGISVKKIQAQSSDIAMAMAARGDIRIEAPIKGKSAVGVEVPNDSQDIVGLKDIIESESFLTAKAPLTFALGKDIDGNVKLCNLAKMPHLLVAGSTGSGKSVCLSALVISLIYRTSPEDLRLIMVDPKKVEFTIFNDLPHLLMPKAITEPKKALVAFDWLIDEMERRYSLFQGVYARNIEEYNAQPEVKNKLKPKLPYIVLIVDELADLVVTAGKKELEERIIRLTQKARAAGIHLILATQRPSVDIITGSIKINLPSRIAFAVSSGFDSKTILDRPGAEKLLGHGDMLYMPPDGEVTRVQGAFVDTPEVKEICDYIRDHNPCVYDENIEKAIMNDGAPNGGDIGGGFSSTPSMDSLLPDALKHAIESRQVSISMLQRRFAIGYQRAAKIIDQMEAAGFISGSDGSKPRTVFATMDDYNKLFGGA